MVAMAAAAIGRDGRAILRGQTMITCEKRLHAILWQIVLGIKPFGSMATAADFRRNFRGTVFQPLDFVLGMAVGAGRGIAHARRHRLAMHAQRPIPDFFIVTRTASLGQVGKVQR